MTSLTNMDHADRKSSSRYSMMKIFHSLPLSRPMILENLFWSPTVITFISGSVFLFKIPSLYFPDADLIDIRPATGTTSFETVATFVFACIYLVPIFDLMPTW